MESLDADLENNPEDRAEVFSAILNLVGDEIVGALKQNEAINQLGLEEKVRKRVSSDGSKLDVYIPNKSFHLHTEFSYIYKDKFGLAPIVKDIVIPSHSNLQRSGIGTLIIKAWEKGFLDQGYKGYFVAYDVSSDIALSFWNKLGYMPSNPDKKFQSFMYKIAKKD
jgi:hypothetical protein